MSPTWEQRLERWREWHRTHHVSASRRLRRMARHTRRRMARDEDFRWLDAHKGGFFWMPCILCGEEFGGHEWRGRITVPRTDRINTGVCLACELDVGAQAAIWCAKAGHTPLKVGAEVPVRVPREGDGRDDHSVTVSIDFTPVLAYCRTCGIDLPLRP